MFPIQIRLTVGTQAELDRLTTFVAGNTDANVKSAPMLPAEAPGKPSTVKTAPSPRTAEAAPSPAAQPDAAPATPTTDTQPAATVSSATADAVDYPTLQKAVLALHKIDPTAAVPIAKALGADTFKLLKPEQWAYALAKVNAAICDRSTEAG